MNPYLILIILLLYFGLLITIAYYTSKNSKDSTFFNGDKNSPWHLVAIGMIGASLSGVTFISIPGWVGNGANQFSYMQAVFGYFIGYIAVAYILLPIYYKLNVISIYEYLQNRFGIITHKTGSVFFIISRVIGASVRLMLVAEVLQYVLFEKFNIPFELTVIVCILLIWIYTKKGGIKTIVWTDTIQTGFMLLSLLLTIFFLKDSLGLSENEGLFQTVNNSQYSQIFFFNDIHSSNHFLKHFIGGIFITIGMTGLDQDMMQKNLTCRNLKESQKNMITMATILIVVNFLFLFLGALLYMYAQKNSINFDKPDLLFAAVAMDSTGNLMIGVLFMLGLIAAAYSSADSALTSLTTSIYIDLVPNKLKGQSVNVQIRKTIHLIVSFTIILSVIGLHYFTDDSAIKLLMTFAGFTYGPLIGIFFFGILSKRAIKDIYIPLLCLISIFTTFILWYYSAGAPGVEQGALGIFGKYQFGFEIIILNAFITFILLYLLSKKDIIKHEAEFIR
jgi:Na+/proline symporter